MAFRKMNVVMENDLNSWFVLFIYLLGPSYMLCVFTVTLVTILLHQIYEIRYLLHKLYWGEVVSKMEDLLS